MSLDITKIDDIGMLLHSMDQNSIKNLSPKQKYSLMINHFKPDINYKFPSRYADGCNRSCQYKYFIDNPWFVYSKMEDAYLVFFLLQDKIWDSLYVKSLTLGVRKQESLLSIIHMNIISLL